MEQNTSSQEKSGVGGQWWDINKINKNLKLVIGHGWVSQGSY